MEKEEFPTKKDIVYWLIMVIIIGCFTLAFLVEDPNSVNAKLSLTATVLSISLAIIAIVFSFVQSSDSSRNSLSLMERFNTVAEHISRLNIEKANLKIETTEEFKRLSVLEQESEKFENLLGQAKNELDTQGDTESIITKLRQLFNDQPDKSNASSVDVSVIGQGVVEVGKKSLYRFLRMNFEGNRDNRIGLINQLLLRRGFLLCKKNSTLEVRAHVGRGQIGGTKKMERLRDGYDQAHRIVSQGDGGGRAQKNFCCD
ncbi:hypothetical protein [Paenibacillus sp. SYP-B4298]|uniref:hypothetical protein n=1 Tax=Paenibacillus sp. SYP-B4298 TaxID=2996034 RepID=UPI0022DE00FE|nr:hypothetical protein [Paenibacillus sp. SYP-B4298]